MACENVDKRKCFSFIWEIENANYFWQNEGKWFPSPSFIVDEIEGTMWKLGLNSFYHRVDRNKNRILIDLRREKGSKGAQLVGIEWQFALLASDGTVLSSCSRRKGEFPKGQFGPGDYIPEKGEDVFDARKAEFLPQGTLTVCCRIWKKVGEMSKDIQWVARSRIVVDTRSFLWEVGHLNTLVSEKKYTYEIKSLETSDQLISVDLSLTGALKSEEIRFAITPKDPKIKFYTLELYPVDTFGNAYQCLKDEFPLGAVHERLQFPICLSKQKVMEKGNFLSLWCVCRFASGTILQEIERAISDRITFENSIMENRYLDEENISPDLKRVLNDDLKAMLNEKIQTDIKLRTGSKTYHAHKCILSVRSPVFNAMFSNDMKEKISDCVDIEDLNDDTVSHMLRYIYSAEVEDLEWVSATQLYEAADRYEILTLRDVCSSYLKKDLCRKNACEALVLADLHQDEDLKGVVQDFIVTHGKNIIFSEEWKKLMETHLKLAAETMCLKFKE